jgi:phenylpropionate dioxygenase-like ring-hydroxylating dioxygenase large terminal subunit
MKSDLRRTEINLNHWYAVARSSEIRINQIVSVTLWGVDIAIYRDVDKQIYSLEDRCPHRNVRLSHGRLVNSSVECAYHGWRIDRHGSCVHVPYLLEQQKLPNCSIRTYPIREQCGFIWLFAGEPGLAERTACMKMPEWDHPNYVASVALINTRAHFSFLIDNLIDMYHGHLHAKYQAWSEAKLMTIKESDQRVEASYQAHSHMQVKSIFSPAQLFLPQLRKPRLVDLNVSYTYPHWSSSLATDFRLYCLLCPISMTHTKAYLIHFTSLESFTGLHRFPLRFRVLIKGLFFNSAKILLDRLIAQDVQMIEEEQRAYARHPERRIVELNPALLAVQRLITSQAGVSR